MWIMWGVLESIAAASTAAWTVVKAPPAPDWSTRNVVAEAAGPSYRDFARIAMNTGLPTVVGWEWHLQQRGQSLVAIVARFADLDELYSGADPKARRSVLDRQ